MGVSDLLPKLKSIISMTHISKYRGKRAAIDASGWLYKGAYTCVVELGLGTLESDPIGEYIEGEATAPYISYCLARLELLLEHDITPTFVFDGATVPAKAATNQKRRATRETYRRQGAELHAAGDSGKSFSAFCRALHVTRAMARKLFVTLRAKYPNIRCLVAPYEADAQLALLSKEKLVDVVFSEDSDCIPYGCKTVFFKLENNGYGEEFRRRYMGANEDMSFTGWSEDMFVQFCILAGCDYCPTLKGVGPVAAHALVETHRTPTRVLAERRQRRRSHAATTSFRRAYLEAILTFRHHLVFDETRQKCRMLNPLSASTEVLALHGGSLSCLGRVDLPDAIVVGIANGSLNPNTHAPEPVGARTRPRGDQEAPASKRARAV
ncbi:hypothetical protein SPRG_08289 [Saprolegnia parasitica CBS 223.65]|uniref:Exonuclease 1 n=1 Tax=Saprolegnia parasitica (strain CBS 223.65) TaxID=695850 RepID=A0A067CIV1_SAPPC|nr:hypothetical protein SPRG_08289 [Saprolegnia parasitica CBS 223.65]KDO26486.1 hypothetical protein SPRG_08289 [Saprolegnia parasitica CBS 223.65]|eukprot:XP_012202921.1 hypothetical protein SPRG_08289 [Saprolegnia parasitica CBS 223.65]